MLLGAFRSNEVLPGDLLAVILDQIQKDPNVYMETIDLGPLDHESVRSIVSTTLIGHVGPISNPMVRRSQQHQPHLHNIEELITLIFNKTEGNPFFVLQVSSVITFVSNTLSKSRLFFLFIGFFFHSF